jgi:hypothetical protein
LTHLIKHEVLDDVEVFWVRNRDGSVDRMVMQALFPKSDFIIQAETGQAKLVTTLPARTVWYARVSPQKLTGLAVLIAGRRRAVLGQEWRAHLSGETGRGLPADQQIREAAGFIYAAMRYRLQDTADLAWRPMDVVLASRELSNLIVMLATLIVAVISIHGAGLYGLASNLANVAVVWGAAYGIVRLGRWWRGVKPPEHRPRRNKELAQCPLQSCRGSTVDRQGRAGRRVQVTAMTDAI